METKPTNKIHFDELDLKCFSEMPLLLDVISATGNKVTRIMTPLYREMNELIKKSLKKDWQIGKKSYECQIFPLTFEEDTKISIKSLDTNFKIESAILVSKIVKGKEVNFFWTYFGYSCSNQEDESVNHFYFTLGKGDLKERYGGILNKLKFYSQIEKKITSFRLNIKHPEKGDDSELIEIILEEFSVDKFKEAFQVYKEHILTPFLLTLEGNA